MSPAGLPALATHTVGKEVSQSADTSAEDILATRLQQFEAVSTVTAEITRELDLTTLLGLITRRAVELIDAAVSGAILLWDETEQLLIPHAWHGYGEWMRGIRLKPGEAIAGAVAQCRQGLRINNYQASPYAHPTFVQHTGATAILAEPLQYHDRLVGVIVLNNGTTEEAFTVQDQALLSIFGAQAAIAIENAQLCAEIHKQTTQLEQRRAAVQNGTPYDLVLLDMHMPVMDGLTLARIMKADPALARLPLVMLTSVAQRGHSMLAREAGISACLTKPVRQSQLFDCVATVLRAAVAPEVPRVPPATLGLPRQTPLMLVAEDNIVNQRVSACGSDMTGGSGVENVRGRVISITLWDVCRPAEDYSVEGHTSKRLLVTL